MVGSSPAQTTVWRVDTASSTIICMSVGPFVCVCLYLERKYLENFAFKSLKKKNLSVFQGVTDKKAFWTNGKRFRSGVMPEPELEKWVQQPSFKCLKHESMWAACFI